jgi:hypothetical protein
MDRIFEGTTEPGEEPMAPLRFITPRKKLNLII